MAQVIMDAFNIERDLEYAIEVFDISLYVQPDGCFVATENKNIVGTGCFYIYNLLAWIGEVAVIRTHQRRGIGTKIMVTLLEELKRRGVKTICLDATDAGYRLYKKLGFREMYRTTVYELKDPYNINKEKTIDVEVTDFLPVWAVELDKEIFGADRIRALRAWIRRGAKVLLVHGKGYALVKRNKIGPLISKDFGVAEKLLKQGINMGANIIIVPEANIRALELVKKYGFKPKSSCRRMCLGGKPNEKIEHIYALLSYAKG